MAQWFNNLALTLQPATLVASSDDKAIVNNQFKNDNLTDSS